MKRTEKRIGLAVLALFAICLATVWFAPLPMGHASAASHSPLTPLARAGSAAAMPACGTAAGALEGQELIVAGGGTANPTKICYCRSAPMAADGGVIPDGFDGGFAGAGATMGQYQWCGLVLSDTGGAKGGVTCTGGSATVCP